MTDLNKQGVSFSKKEGHETKLESRIPPQEYYWTCTVAVILIITNVIENLFN